MKAPLLVAAALIVTAACGNAAHEQAAPSEERIVASIGDRQIRHSEIRCDKRFVADSERCRDVEQYNLDRILLPELIVQTAALHGISLSDAEVLATMSDDPALRQENLEKGDATMKAVARAFLLVQSGADADEVFERDLAPRGVPRPFFDGFLEQTEKAKAERILRTDIAEQGKQQLIAQRRQMLALHALHDVAEKQAAENGIRATDARRTLWLDAVERTNLTIIDPTYRMPNLEKLYE